MRFIHLLRNQFAHIKFAFRSCALLSTPEPKHKTLENFPVNCTANLKISENSLHANKMSESMNEFIRPNHTKVAFLDCVTAFEALTEKEKLYAHYFNRASWYGTLIVLIQTSQESPLIFVLFHKLFRLQSVSELKEIALSECGFTEDDFTAFLVYAASFFDNVSNYTSFGDTKFIPNLEKDKFVKLLRSSKFGKTDSNHLERLLSNCLEKMYSIEENEQRLNFPEKGTTKYLSKSVTLEDEKLVKEYLVNKGIDAFNSRLFKHIDEAGNPYLEIRLASVLQNEDEEAKDLLSKHTGNGVKFQITRGDYSPLLKLVNENLKTAKDYAANKEQEKMIEYYMKSFYTGSLDDHKDGSRYWIKDKGPTIETYIGFIENYRDPAGVRGEFEGFVAVVNKPQSEKYAELVRTAEYFLSELPWPRSYEKDVFLKPDFTNLDVLGFYTSGIPIGINIPNYDAIRQTEGFKNVNLGNVISSRPKEPPNYLCESDQDLILKYGVEATEINVALHELLGHGSGKMFKREKDGSFNFDVENVLHLETNDKLSTWYEEGQTYESVFGVLASAVEECRAESIALYLFPNEKLYKIFKYDDQEMVENLIYVGWLQMLLSGLVGVLFYDPKTEKWLQAHCQCRHAILRALVEDDDGLFKIEQCAGKDGKPDLLVTLDRSKILTVGKPKIGAFLQKIQLYKATADMKSTAALFHKYTDISNEGKYPWLTFRDIVMARKKPRSLTVQGTTFIEDGKVQLKKYEPNFEGLLQSWVDKIQDQNVDGILEELWLKDKEHF